jgi:hypothetical protein
MARGYAGKILRINLTDKSISTIDTEKYEEFGGGYGMGTAIFWDLAVAPGEYDKKDRMIPGMSSPIMVAPLLQPVFRVQAGQTSAGCLLRHTLPVNLARVISVAVLVHAQT